MFSFPQIDAQISELARQVENYCHRQPVQQANDLASESVDEFNRWLQAESRVLEGDKAQLDRLLGDIRRLEAEADELQKKREGLQGGLRAPEQVTAYNRLVEQINGTVQRHRTVAAEFKPRQDAYNARVSHFNEEAKRRREAVEEAQRKARASAEAHLGWLRGRGPELLSRSLNQVLSNLQAEKSRTPAEAAAYDSLIAQVRTLRLALGAHAVREQKQSEHGLLLVKATLGGLNGDRAEDCFMFADNAATFSSITPEMATALGLDGYHGEEVELNLPNGIRIKAPQLVIPAISVDGHTAEFVKAVVLSESSPGVDGSIGLSFLSRFDFAIHKDSPQRLVLSPLQSADEASQFDVFICHKSEDGEYAQRVYAVLTKGGHRPFLSEVSLGGLATGDYHKAIDSAIEGARDLIVIASSREHLTSAWVEAEWRRFDCLILGGRKRGKIVPILCGGMTVNHLPPALFRYSAVIMGDDPGWQMKLLAALPRH